MWHWLWMGRPEMYAHRGKLKTVPRAAGTRRSDERLAAEVSAVHDRVTTALDRCGVSDVSAHLVGAASHPGVGAVLLTAHLGAVLKASHVRPSRTMSHSVTHVSEYHPPTPRGGRVPERSGRDLQLPHRGVLLDRLGSFPPRRGGSRRCSLLAMFCPLVAERLQGSPCHQR